MTLSQALQQTPQTSSVQRSGFSWHQTNKCLSRAAAVLRSSFIAMLIASLAGHQPVTLLLLIGLRLRTDQLIKKCFCQRATHWRWPAPFPNCSQSLFTSTHDPSLQNRQHTEASHNYSSLFLPFSLSLCSLL